MTLHIFNPEHDIALASGLANFTAPHAGRQLRHDLGWLPVLWASEDDAVLVEDVAAARRAIARRTVGTRLLVDGRVLSSLTVSHIEPWGWNAALCAQLRRHGLKATDGRGGALPSAEQLQGIRELSHRRTAASILPLLQTDGTIGEAIVCHSMEEVAEQVGRFGRAVVKAPWSSSGRGVRFINDGYSGGKTAGHSEGDEGKNAGHSEDGNIAGWLRNTLQRQGAVMAEPYYNKVKDFGMEFYSDDEGHISYQGLSLFHTSNGAYTGNIIATEQAKRKVLSRYLPTLLLDETQERICRVLGPVFKGRYRGPFGVDMMVVRKLDANYLHPCVEINLRRTMGHVALALNKVYNPTEDDEIKHVMRINYIKNNYKLQIKRQ